MVMSYVQMAGRLSCGSLRYNPIASCEKPFLITCKDVQPVLVHAIHCCKNMFRDDTNFAEQLHEGSQRPVVIHCNFNEVRMPKELTVFHSESSTCERVLVVSVQRIIRAQ